MAAGAITTKNRMARSITSQRHPPLSRPILIVVSCQGGSRLMMASSPHSLISGAQGLLVYGSGQGLSGLDDHENQRAGRSLDLCSMPMLKAPGLRERRCQPQREPEAVFLARPGTGLKWRRPLYGH